MKEQGVIMKLVAIKPEQQQALSYLKQKHGFTHAHVIREGIDLALDRYAHLFPRNTATQSSAKKELSK